MSNAIKILTLTNRKCGRNSPKIQIFVLHILQFVIFKGFKNWTENFHENLHS